MRYWSDDLVTAIKQECLKLLRVLARDHRTVDAVVLDRTYLIGAS